MEINLQNQEVFNLFSNGNPDIKLIGKITELNLQSSGNADILAGELVAGKITLSTNGNADVQVNTKNLVEKEIRGNNEITNLYGVSKKVQLPDNDKYKTNIKTEMIGFKIKNNSALPEKITLVSYRPDRTGNGTIMFTLIPLGI